MKRDIVRTLRTQAQLFRKMENPAQGDILVRAAEEVEGLRARLAEVEAQRDELNGLLVSTMSGRNTFETAIVLHRKIDEALAKLEASDG